MSRLPEKSPHKKMKILVIDDDANMRRLISFLMKDKGCEVLTAEDAGRGFETALLEIPDLIILDIFMPGLNGLELLKWFRRNEKSRRTPILMLTADKSDTSKTTALLRRADGYITKPFDLPDLYRAVNDLLPRRISLHDQ